MEDIWQPEDIIQALVADLKVDTATWDQVEACWRESNERCEMGKRIGKRPDLEPECFPEIEQPHLANVTNDFLERKFGKRFKLLNAQLALATAEHCTDN